MDLFFRLLMLRAPEGSGSSGGGGGDDGGGGEGSDPGSGGGGGGTEDFEARLRKAVDEQTSGLRNKNSELLGKNKQLKEQLEKFTEQIERLGGDEGIERLRKLRENLEKDEVGKLLAEGKHDEWFEARTQALQKDHEKTVQKLEQELEQERSIRVESDRLYEDEVLKNSIASACIECKVVPSAHEDVQNAARKVFVVDRENGPVMKEGDEVVLGKDGKAPKSVKEWLGDQAELRRHWFPESEGAGASSSTSGGAQGGAVDLSNVASMKEYREARKKLGLGSGVGVHSP